MRGGQGREVRRLGGALEATAKRLGEATAAGREQAGRARKAEGRAGETAEQAAAAVARRQREAAQEIRAAHEGVKGREKAGFHAVVKRLEKAALRL